MFKKTELPTFAIKTFYMFYFSNKHGLQYFTFVIIAETS